MADETRTQGDPGAASHAGHAASTEELSAQVEVLKRDISEISRTLKALGRERRDEAIGSARATATDVRTQFDDWAEEAVAPVRRRPGAAVGLAVVFGFLLGLLGKRK